MTSEDIRKVADDIALAIRARGQTLGDILRQAGRPESAVLVAGFFDQAADVALIRGNLLAIDTYEPTPKGPR